MSSHSEPRLFAVTRRTGQTRWYGCLLVSIRDHFLFSGTVMYATHALDAFTQFENENTLAPA